MVLWDWGGLLEGCVLPRNSQASAPLSPLFRFGTAIPGADGTLYPGEFIGKFGSGLYHYDPGKGSVGKRHLLQTRPAECHTSGHHHDWDVFPNSLDGIGAHRGRIRLAGD